MMKRIEEAKVEMEEKARSIWESEAKMCMSDEQQKQFERSNEGFSSYVEDNSKVSPNQNPTKGLLIDRK